MTCTVLKLVDGKWNDVGSVKSPGTLTLAGYDPAGCYNVKCVTTDTIKSAKVVFSGSVPTHTSWGSEAYLSGRADGGGCSTLAKSCSDLDVTIQARRTVEGENEGTPVPDNHVCAAVKIKCADAPKPAPVTPPVRAPKPAPVTPPVAAPKPAPVTPPVRAPVRAPKPAPVTPPVAAPKPAPVTPPVRAPVQAPKPAPVTPPVAKPDACPEFACAKCGQILECYVEAEETSAEYLAAKKYIESSSFCNGFKTTCGGQQCAQSQGLVVYPVSKADPVCPKIGGFKCKAGNSLGNTIGAGLSNWNTYKVCPGATKTTLSCDVKCESGKCGCKFATDMCDKCY